MTAARATSHRTLTEAKWLSLCTDNCPRA